MILCIYLIWIFQNFRLLDSRKGKHRLKRKREVLFGKTSWQSFHLFLSLHLCGGGSFRKHFFAAAHRQGAGLAGNKLAIWKTKEKAAGMGREAAQILKRVSVENFKIFQFWSSFLLLDQLIHIQDKPTSPSHKHNTDTKIIKCFWSFAGGASVFAYGSDSPGREFWPKCVTFFK